MASVRVFRGWRVVRSYWWLMISLGVTRLIELGLPNRKSVADIVIHSLIAIGSILYGLHQIRALGRARDLAPEESFSLTERFWTEMLDHLPLRKSRHMSLTREEPRNQDPETLGAP